MSEFPKTLKHWRKARRFSQLDLAAEANVSLRHLSFLETGRSRPSPEMIGRLSDALELPLDARNRMLTHAGFAARYPARKWEADEMAPIRAAITYALAAHAPYPALAVDRLWTVRQMNGSAKALFAPMGIGEGGSLIDLMCSEALPQLVENWAQVAHHAVRRLRTESAAQGGVAELDRAADHLARVPPPRDPASGPVIATILRAGDLRLSLFATIAQFGTPEDLTLDDLKIELYFPADAETEAALRALGQTPVSDA